MSEEKNEQIDEDLEFLKNQIRQKNKLKQQNQPEQEEDYSYIKRFKVNAYIEYVAGLIGLIFGIVTKNYMIDCIGVILICFGFLFHNVAKHGEYKRDKNNK